MDVTNLISELRSELEEIEEEILLLERLDSGTWLPWAQSETEN
jgi:hypothetical protein